MKRVVLLFVVVGAVFLSGISWAGESPEGWRIERGPDGFEVAVPPGATTVSGPDGRMVAVPAEWTVERGPDGRAVAVPPEGTIERGPDNRLVAIPKGWTAEVGSDGRAVAVPSGGRTERGTDNRLIVVPEGWMVETGPDGRAVAVPPGGTTVLRPDGRLVAVPEGWSVEEGSDGLAVAVPPGGEIVEGPEGRGVVVPPLDFEWDDPLVQSVILDAQAQPRMWDVYLAQRNARVRIVQIEDENEDGDLVVVSRTGYVDFDTIEWTETLTDVEYYGLQQQLAGQEADFHAMEPFEEELDEDQDESYLLSLLPAETATIIVNASSTD